MFQAGGTELTPIRTLQNKQLIALKSQYANLHRISKEFKCYSQQCNEQNPINCYSPLCVKRARLRRELQAILAKGIPRNSNNIVTNKVIKQGKIVLI